MQDDTKTILMSLTDSLNRVAENIALLSRTLLKEDALTPPAFVVAAQEVLDVANATMDKAVKQNEEATLDTTEENSNETSKSAPREICWRQRIPQGTTRCSR